MQKDESLKEDDYNLRSRMPKVDYDIRSHDPDKLIIGESGSDDLNGDCGLHIAPQSSKVLIAEAHIGQDNIFKASTVIS